MSENFAVCLSDNTAAAAASALPPLPARLRLTTACVTPLFLRSCYQVLDDSQAQGQQSVKSKVQAKCCFALETFCENLGDEIVPFLEPLMARLCALLRAAPRDTQEICVSAIASVALASEARFTPYFAPTYELMRTLLQQTRLLELANRRRRVRYQMQR